MIGYGGVQFDDPSMARIAEVTRFVEANRERIEKAGKARITPRSRGQFLAIIRTEGPEAQADHPDKRHWVEAVRCDNDSEDPDDAELAVVERDDDDDLARYVTATNTADVDDEHYAPEGACVHVHWEIDAGETMRYWFAL